MTLPYVTKMEWIVIQKFKVASIIDDTLVLTGEGVTHEINEGGNLIIEIPIIITSTDGTLSDASVTVGDTDLEFL